MDRFRGTWPVIFHAKLGKRISVMRLLILFLDRFCRACGYRLVRVSTGPNKPPSVSPYKNVKVYDNDWYD